MNGDKNTDEQIIAEKEEQNKFTRENLRGLAIETLKRKKFAEAKEMLKRQTYTARLKRRYAHKAAQQALKSQAVGAAKKLAAQAARQVVLFAARIIAAVIASFGVYIVIAILIVIVIVLIVAAIKYTCEETTVGWAVCNAAKGILWLKEQVGL